MKLTVKTLKGGKFEIEAEETNTVAEVKGIIETNKSELPAAGMKLIHSGKVLKDEDTISSCGIKPNDFLVVMVTKAKKAATPAPAPAAAAAAKPTTEQPKTPAPASTEAAKTPAPAEAPATATNATAAAPPAAPGGAAPDDSNISAEAVENLTAMGFPEAEVRHCLRAAQGNPDVAVEFLTNGIPEGISAIAGSGSSSPSAAGAGSGGETLQALRNHPQFNDLRRLVQSNPQMLQQVLAQIGQQQPELLAEIQANQDVFLRMMNEPIVESTTSTTTGSSSTSSSSPATGGAMPGSFAGAGGGLGGAGPMGANPAQMAQLIQNMSPEEINQMAAMMGLTPEQLRQTAEMIGRMPPEQLNQFMMQAMGAGGAGGGAPPGMGGFMGGAGGGGGPTVLRLTEEEMAAVDRLTEMGFDRSEAAQAFLACDKNEALAANLLMDSMGDGAGGAFGFGGGGGGSGGGGGNDSGGSGGDGGDGSGGSGNNDDSGNGDDKDNSDEMYD